MSLDRATQEIIANADAYADRTPTLRTLLAELAEYAYALDGDHEHSPEYELIEIGGIALNMLRQRYAALTIASTRPGELAGLEGAPTIKERAVTRPAGDA